MANMEIPRPSSAPNFGPLSSPRRSEAYAPSLDSAERHQATFLEDIEMQAGMRNRQHHGPPDLPRDEQDASSTDSNTTWTPTSNSDHEETRARLRISDRVRRLLARIPPHPFSRTTDQDLLDKELGYDDIEYEELKNFVKGIPQLSKLQDSDDSFRIIRRYGTPAFRVLLYKQIEIHKLVKELHRLDAADETSDSLRYRLHSVQELEGSDFEKSKLMDKLEVQISKYYDFVLKYANIQALTDVPARDHRSVQNWIVWNKPLLEGEDDFFKVRDDLAFAKTKRSSGGQYSNIIEDLIESCRARYPNSWINALFRDPKVDKNGNGAATVDHTASKIRLVLSNVIVALSAITIVLVPVFLMFLINVNRQTMAAIVTGFVFVFMVLIAPIVNVGAHELFLCIAGYSAVLVAILGSKMSQGSGCPSK